MKILLYILIASACLSVLYLAYQFLYRKQENFRELRIYLMGSVLISLLVPLNHLSIELKDNHASAAVMQVLGSQHEASVQPDDDASAITVNKKAIAISLYILVTGILLGRILLQLIVLTYNYVVAKKIRNAGCVILLNHRFKSTFSFFTWIFVAPGAYSRKDLDQIITHEKIHASQYHSFDLIVIELLTAVMWFNPLIWMMKNSMQLVHEYLADEGALLTGIDRLSYQALLINQITEEKLICLSSSFNHSLIKKRLIMMTTSNAYQKTRVKLLALIPLSASLLVAMAILNGMFSANLLAETSAGKSLQTSLGQAAQLMSTAPGDTVKKEKIVKIISADDQQDTVITETFTIKVSGDTLKKEVIIYQNSGESDGTSRVAFISADRDLKDVQNMDPDSIVWVTVTKDGDKTVTKEGDKMTETVTVNKGVEIRLGDGDNVPDNTLIFINGVKQADNKAFTTLDPDQIESIEIIKDKTKMKIYTDKDCEGVIVIRTKSGKK